MASLKTLIPCLALVILLSLVSFTESKEFHVGGKKDKWQVPSTSDSYSQWAQKRRFRIGDSLVFEYDEKVDSVLEVSKSDYSKCNRLNPIIAHTDGKTKIELQKSGPFFFISGAEGHCQKGQKLEVVVLSPKHSHHAPSPAPTPATHHHAPAPAPHNGGSSLKVGLLVAVSAFVGILSLRV